MSFDGAFADVDTPLEPILIALPQDPLCRRRVAWFDEDQIS